MAEFEIQLAHPEPNETNCFGDDFDVSWERMYHATDRSSDPPTLVSGTLRYTAPDDYEGRATLEVDFVAPDALQGRLSPHELFTIFADNDKAAEIVRSALPTVIAYRKAIEQARSARKA